ncbi:MAG: RraA family protein [Rhodospirillales bacterium]|nr:RraA family protein [Rhodospirillales bacterium]
MEGRGALDYRIAPLLPEMRIVGTALTAFVGPGDNLAALAALDLLRTGDILVIGAAGNCSRAVMGDNMGIVAKRRGAVGVVTDGTLRDGAELIELGLPCFCCGLTPVSTGSRGPGEVGLPMAMGNETVASGDLVVGDRDGVIVVPHQDIPAMLDGLDAVHAKEAAQNAALKEGEIPSMLRRRYPGIDAETTFVE